MLLSVILPVHNEENIIKSTFDEIYREVKYVEKNSEFILVENGSVDNTFHVIKELAKGYKDTEVTVAPKGYGSAILQGLKVARGVFVSYLPSDGQVDLQVFPDLWKLSQENTWNIVKVKRLHRETIFRTFVSFCFSVIIALLFKTKFIDVNGSPRILKSTDVKSLHLKAKDSFIDAEMLIKASKLAWKIKEIPMTNLERTGGKSTRSYKTFVEFFLNIYKYRFGSLRHY